MAIKAPKVTRKKITDYVPDGRNANSGSPRGLQMLEDSLHEDGAGRSIVADKDGRIPAGNKTLEAAMNAGIEDVIEIETDGTALIVHKRSDWNLDDPKGAARRYAYRDNRVSEVSLNWDANVIASDIEAGLDLSGMWTVSEIELIVNVDDDVEQRYSRKIDIPIYEPSNQKPAISELYDNAKTSQLLAEIETANLTDDERSFLMLAASRHIVFNYAKIADLYAHGNSDLQRLMENSVLVIVDFDRAIELGYVKLTQEIADMVSDEND